MGFKSRVVHGDCLQVMAKMPDNCISTIITDPPYGLSNKRSSERIFDIFQRSFNIIFPNFNEFNTKRLKYSDLARVSLQGTDLGGVEIMNVIKSFVGVPESSVDFNSDIKMRDKKVKTSRVSSSTLISNKKLRNKVDFERGKNIGNYILDFGDSFNLSGGNIIGGNIGEFSLGTFTMPISFIQTAFGPDSLTNKNFSCFSEGLSDLIGLSDNSFSQSSGASFILASGGAENGLVLKFVLTNTTGKFNTTISTVEGDTVSNFICPKLVRTFATASSLSSKLEPCLVRFIANSADGTDSIYCFHLYLPKNLMNKIEISSEKSSGFMGKKWDYDVPSTVIWRKALRVAKPGCMMLVFGGTRTFHRLTCNIEDAGWEIRDCMMWLYGSGFPKSYNISKGIDKQRTPEQIVIFDKIRLKFNKYRQKRKLSIKGINTFFGYATNDSGMAGHWFANITQQILPNKVQYFRLKKLLLFDAELDYLFLNLKKGRDRPVIGKHQAPAKSIYTQGKQELSKDINLTASASLEAETWEGYGTALKPAWEPILVCMKPLEGTFAQNVLKHGVAGLNIDGGRVGTGVKDDYGRSAANAKGTVNAHDGFEGKSFKIKERSGEYANQQGRWPANVILDEDAGKLLDEQSGHLHGIGNAKPSKGIGTGSGVTYMIQKPQGTIYPGDSGGASRFFYCAKTSKRERNAGMPSGQINNHPTVKPLALLDYLCKLTKTPSHGIVMDMFAGSGSLALAAAKNDIPFLLIEKDAESYQIAKAKAKYAIAYCKIKVKEKD